MDIGKNTEFNWKLTPKDDKSVNCQSEPMPIQLEKDIFLEKVLMQKYGIITKLLFSKYESPIFSQRIPNGKLRLLVVLRKINSLIADDYTSNNHPVSTMSDAAQHLARKSLFCKHSFFLAEFSPAKDLHKVPAGLCLTFHVSSVST